MTETCTDTKHASAASTIEFQANKTYRIVKAVMDPVAKTAHRSLLEEIIMSSDDDDIMLGGFGLVGPARGYEKGHVVIHFGIAEHAYPEWERRVRAAGIHFVNDPEAALNDTRAPGECVEQASKLLSEWLGYAWDGLGDRDISADWPDWTYGFNGRSLQGGKPAVRRIVERVLDAANARTTDDWRDMATAPARDVGETDHAWFLARVSPAYRVGRPSVIVARLIRSHGNTFLKVADSDENLTSDRHFFESYDLDLVDAWMPLPAT
jgi:hypothetical protein